MLNLCVSGSLNSCDVLLNDAPVCRERERERVVQQMEGGEVKSMSVSGLRGGFAKKL